MIHSIDKPFGLFAYLVLYTGLRKGEALALTYMDITNGEIMINKSVYYEGMQPKIKWPKTQAGTRKVPILTPLADVLPEQKTGPVFPNASGALMTDSEYKAEWKKYIVATGISCTPHQLRHPYVKPATKDI